MKEFGFYLKRKRKKKKLQVSGDHIAHCTSIQSCFQGGWAGSTALPSRRVLCAGLYTPGGRAGHFIAKARISVTPAPTPRQPRSPGGPHSRSTLAFSASSVTSPDKPKHSAGRSSLRSPRQGPRTAGTPGAPSPLPAGRYITQRGAGTERPPPRRRGLGVSGAPAARPRRLGGPGEAPRHSHTHTYTRTHALCNAAPGEPRDPAGSSRLPGWGGRGGARGGLGA